MIKKIVRNFLVKLLGIEEREQAIRDLYSKWNAIEKFMTLGVDINMNSLRGNTQFIIISNLGGPSESYVRIFEKNLKSYSELLSFVRHIKDLYPIDRLHFDAHPGSRDFFHDFKEREGFK